MEKHEIMWAKQSPDLYDGATCDQEKARWLINSEGDKGDTDWRPEVLLAAEHFPPGTTITIAVPCCPKCDLQFDAGPDPQTGSIERDHKCACGFNWDEWVANEYS